MILKRGRRKSLPQVGSMICCPYKYRRIRVGAEYYSAHNDGSNRRADSLKIRHTDADR